MGERPRTTPAEDAKLIARDLLRVWKREHACPLCGAISPPCQHIAAAERLR